MAAVAVFGFTNVNAQDDDSNGGQTSQGKWLIEANTGNAVSVQGIGAGGIATTGIYFTSTDSFSSFNLGLDGGYFIMDDLAIKAGLGYGSFKPDGGDAASTFSYRLGAKYYVNSMIPVTVDLTGASGEDVFGDETPLWLGLGAGYAWFIGDNVSIEPGLRYNLSLNEDYTDEGVLQFNVGFALHF